MKVQIVLGSILLTALVSFAQPADSLLKKNALPQTTVSYTEAKENSKTLTKQQLTIRKNTTTWSKIKDLFM
jgi:hypothetical protein